MEDYYILGYNIHVNKINKEFDLNKEENQHVLANLKVTIDGSIIGVKKEIVASLLKDPEVKSIRFGYKKIAHEYKIDSADALYKLLAMFIPIEEE